MALGRQSNKARSLEPALLGAGGAPGTTKKQSLGLTPNGGGSVAPTDHMHDCPLWLEWVDVSPHLKSSPPGGPPLFSPRCAHAVAVLPPTSSLSASSVGLQPCAFASIGGCSETEYFPLDEVRVCVGWGA